MINFLIESIGGMLLFLLPSYVWSIYEISSPRENKLKKAEMDENILCF